MAQIGQLGRVLLQDCCHGFGRSVEAKCTQASRHFVQHRAKGEDVRARIGHLTPDVLRRHVVRRPHDHARGGVRAR